MAKRKSHKSHKSCTRGCSHTPLPPRNKKGQFKKRGR